MLGAAITDVVELSGGIASTMLALTARCPTTVAGDGAGAVAVMAEMLDTVHDVRPAEPFRTYQSWARRRSG